VSLTQASMAQADEVKMISAWAAILSPRRWWAPPTGRTSTTCPSCAGSWATPSPWR
jgi:hypothetical protein